MAAAHRGCWSRWRCSALLLAAVPLLALGSTGAVSPEQLRRGEYVFHSAGCAGCHTDRDNEGEPLAGGRPLKTPFGTFYSPNITPHREYGIGDWSDADFLRALKAGLAPDRSFYYPSFPYPAYAGMSRDDVLALKAYLFSLAPVARPNRDHELPWYLRWRAGLWLWRTLYFDSSPVDTHDDPELARGAYLAEALAHCGECHTPRNPLGGLRQARKYAGTHEGPEGKTVPNITPDRKTGIGRWSRDDLVFYFQLGLTPGGDAAGGLMAEVIDDGLSKLTPGDQEALASYLLSQRAIVNPLRRDKAESRPRGEFD